MEPKIRFKLMPRPDAIGKRAIVMVVNCGFYKMSGEKKLYTPLFYPTHKKIHPDNWISTIKEKEKKIPVYRAKRKFSDLNTDLSNFETDALKVVKDLHEKKELSNDNIKIELDRINDSSKNVPASTLNDYIKEYVNSIDNGTRLNSKGKLFARGTVKVFRTFENVFQLFQDHKNKTYDFNGIDYGFYKDYTGFLTSVELTSMGKVIKTKYSPNNIGGHVKRLKMILRAAREDGFELNSFIDSNKFKVFTETVPMVYLTDHEVGAMYNLKLTDDLDIIRDVFLAGCYTAQRFSDYSRIKKDNIKGDLLYLTQQKTGNKVVIPIKAELKKILKKYNNTLPYTYEQQLNSNIKLIARMAGITQPVVFERTNGGETTEHTQEKCTLISSHTARRTGCTNLFNAGMNSLDIMKISGHKTEKELLNYIRVEAEDSAKKVAKHPWFTQEYTPMKIAR